MSLPSFGIVWKQYRNVTPTFNLTPIEKPDTSPYLVHMTGRSNLLKILRAENAPQETVSPRHGFFKSAIPTFDFSRNYYNSKVVCFTETPICTVDFFRYRSYNMWKADQKYGIGFLDTYTNSRVLSYVIRLKRIKITFSENEEENEKVKETLRRIKPLLFPLFGEYRHRRIHVGVNKKWINQF